MWALQESVLVISTPKYLAALTANTINRTDGTMPQVYLHSHALCIETDYDPSLLHCDQGTHTSSKTSKLIVTWSVTVILLY